MAKSILSDSLNISPSQLYVRDLVKMSAFYRDQIGLETLTSSKDTILLGHDQTSIVELVEKPSLTHASPYAAGLFHNAILYSSQGALSRTVGQLIAANPRSYSGTGDHLVSEAFYFTDPEDNGLELYYDRPTDLWQWKDGQIMMDTLYIDPLEYIQKYASNKAKVDIKLGHIHLRIGNIDQARHFYITLLGFDITADLGSALFVSIAGYHHHIGLNTWLSKDAGVRAPSLGLSAITITLGGSDNVSSLAVRLEVAPYPFNYSGGKIYVSDPWGNAFIFTAN